MKYFLTTADQNGTYDPPSWDTVRQMPGRVDSRNDSDVVVVVQTWHPDFKFNQSFSQLIGDKPWVLIDFREFGWDWDQSETPEWKTRNQDFADFQKVIEDKPPILTFQRELPSGEVFSMRKLPIEYVSWLHESGMATKEEFNSRPIEVLYNWGRSHEDRMRMHGSIFSSAPRFGYDVISQWDHIDKAMADNPNSRKWVSIHAPHYGRIDVREAQKFNQRSKIVIAMPGAGFKTFRHGEMCGDAIMAIPYNDLAWSYPWTAENSIVLEEIPFDHPVKTISDALMDINLYDIYVQAMLNAANYRFDCYSRRHIAGNIEKFL